MEDALACVWLLEAGADPAACAEPVLPDGCPELIVQLGDPYVRAGAAGEEEQPRAFVVGPTTRALWLRPTGRVLTVGIRFRPGRAGRMLGENALGLRDREVPLEALWGAAGRELGERLREARRPEQAADLAIGALRAFRARVRRVPHAGAEWAVDEVFHHRGQIGIEAMARGSGWSRRHLEREVVRAAGMPLRTLRRIARLQHALHLSQGGARRWGEIAHACGYADQAHLVRDFRDLAGRPPEAHRTSAGELTRAFLSVS